MTRPIALVCSSGGHLTQLLALEPWWSRHHRFWVTFDTPDARGALANERAFWCHFPTNRNAWNLLRNTLLALRLIVRERPQMIISTGAAIAVPFFYLGRLFGAKTIFIEVVDRMDTPTLTGRLVQPVSDEILVQWPEQRRLYRRGLVIGRLL